jgi:D-3-phosphoglycerate dehydrogenase
LVVRHKDRVGVLAGVLAVLKDAGVNVEDMQNVVFSGGEAAVARIATVGPLPDEALDRLRASADIYAVSQVHVQE